MEFTKEHEGKDVIALPTGNNARGGKGAEKFRVIKVKRKYIEMAKVYDDGRLGIANNYCPNSGATQKEINSGYGLNAGYIFFNSEEDIEEYKLINKMRDEISQFFNWRSFKLDNEKIKQVYEIIKSTPSTK